MEGRNVKIGLEWGSLDQFKGPFLVEMGTCTLQWTSSSESKFKVHLHFALGGDFLAFCGSLDKGLHPGNIFVFFSVDFFFFFFFLLSGMHLLHF